MMQRRHDAVDENWVDTNTIIAKVISYGDSKAIQPQLFTGSN